MSDPIIQTIIISGFSFLAVIFVIMVFKKNIKKVKTSFFEMESKDSVNNETVIPLEPMAVRIYTDEAVKITMAIGDLESRQLLSSMMKHGEEGLTKFCNLLRQDFRDFVFAKNIQVDQMEALLQESEFVVGCIEREMHGWIKLAMRENSIPLDEEGLKKYISNKFIIWDGETDKIRRTGVRFKSIHNAFLAENKSNYQKYFQILYEMFREAATDEEKIKQQINSKLKKRQELEKTFSTTGKVGCEE